MKLHELSAPQPSKKIAQVFESYFGSRLSLDDMSTRQAQALLRQVRGVLAEHQASPARHVSQHQPAYLKLVMLEQALSARIKENTTVPGQTTTTAAGQQPQTSAGAKPAPVIDPKAAAAKVKDPKLGAALKKSTSGQTLSPDEQKLVAGAALMTAKESRQRWARRLSESEVQQAQVVLAAQDMVDSMQSMLEDVSELQFKDLPALVDSIKNQVGPDQAAQFNADASAALGGLMQNLQQAKQQMDAALGVVTGQAPAGMPATPAPSAPAPEQDFDADLDSDFDAAAQDLDQDDAGAAELGRERR